jgi:acetylornithine deacetylase/succinyl-diaminopimelate desuccinylase-like protein
MKDLKQRGVQPARGVQLFVFPDEETGGREGAHLLSKMRPEKFANVRYWVVEGSGIMAKETLANVGNVKTDAPYIAVAQKYSLPLQMELNTPASADEAVSKSLDALQNLDNYIGGRDWSHLGNDDESHEAYRRLGNLVGGFKGWVLRHFWHTRFVQNRMGPEVAAANRTCFTKTDFYLSGNPSGGVQGPNVKPSSASVVLDVQLSGKQRDKALAAIKDAAGDAFTVQPLAGTLITVTLPQDQYRGGNHGSIPNPREDAVDRTSQALLRIRRKMDRKGWGDNVKVADVYTSKSTPSTLPGSGPVTAKVTLDLRVAIDDDRQQILDEVQQAVGAGVTLRPLIGPEEMDAQVRRLTTSSPLFQAAEQSIRETYGAETPVIFGNTTASNDVRFLMSVSPQSEALTFVPVLYTENGAHGPDEAVTVDSLKQGVDWTERLIEKLGT